MNGEISRERKYMKVVFCDLVLEVVKLWIQTTWMKYEKSVPYSEKESFQIFTGAAEEKRQVGLICLIMSNNECQLLYVAVTFNCCHLVVNKI